jgi:mRNA-degrading endonuclease toxin of MazEF toxin-antitoxin module
VGGARTAELEARLEEARRGEAPGRAVLQGKPEGAPGPEWGGVATAATGIAWRRPTGPGLDAALPDACPHCGGKLEKDDAATQFQAGLPTLRTPGPGSPPSGSTWAIAAAEPGASRAVIPLSSSRAASTLGPEVPPPEGADRPSRAICRGVRTVARARLLRPLDLVASPTLAEIEHALPLILGLDKERKRTDKGDEDDEPVGGLEPPT